MQDSGMDKVSIRVKSIAGECQAGHKIGEEIIVENVNLSGYLCPHALHSLWPFVMTLQMRGKFPWGDGHSTLIACPDGENLVVFEVSRIREGS
jgi:uncharacterized repeat protein (TIGR04076 family)